MDMLTPGLVVINSRCICTRNLHNVYLKYMDFKIMKCIPINNGKRILLKYDIDNKVIFDLRPIKTYNVKTQVPENA